MPFDNLPLPETEIVADPTEIYRKRREAAAELWAKVPVEQWDMHTWISECGTVGCALGWLGMKREDGWEIFDGEPVWRKYWDPIVGAAKYFGCDEDEAKKLFYSFWFSAADVSCALLAMPYTVPASS